MSLLDQEAAASGDHELHASMRSWAVLAKNANDPTRGHERKRQDLASLIEIKLKKYYEALLLQNRIAALSSPDQRVLVAMREWLHGPSRKSGMNSTLDGHEKLILDNEHDLVTLKADLEKDLLSEGLRKYWPFPAKRLSPYRSDPFRYFEDRRLSWVVSSVSIVVATLLLICPIIILYFVVNPSTRLGLVITFIIVFTLGLSVMTSAKRDAIFFASAAYSAVLVVFVSGDLANTK